MVASPELRHQPPGHAACSNCSCGSPRAIPAFPLGLCPPRCPRRDVLGEKQPFAGGLVFGLRALKVAQLRAGGANTGKRGGLGSPLVGADAKPGRVLNHGLSQVSSSSVFTSRACPWCKALTHVLAQAPTPALPRQSPAVPGIAPALPRCLFNSVSVVWTLWVFCL